MDLIIKNRIIDTPIHQIISQVKLENPNGYLKDTKIRGTNLNVTCPFHKQGLENHPSCNIYLGGNTDPDIDSTLEVGHFKCFTCGKSGSLAYFIGHCFNEDVQWGKDWLVDNYGGTFVEDVPVITFDIKSSQPINKEQSDYMDENILENYNSIHPYMFQRKLTPEVISKFKIGYDKENDMITFPIWDINNNLVSISKRSTQGKRFQLETGKEKPIYLLNFVIKDNPDFIWVAESQINALTLQTYNIPAVALMGTGSKYQYNLLNNLNVKGFTLALDPDTAGRRGIYKLGKILCDKYWVNVVDVPEGKDINDLTQEEFNECQILDFYDWELKYKKLLDKILEY